MTRNIVAVCKDPRDRADVVYLISGLPGVKAVTPGLAAKRHLFIEVEEQHASGVAFVIASDARVKTAEDGDLEMALATVEEIDTTLSFGSRDQPLDVARWFHNYNNDGPRYLTPREFGRQVTYRRDTTRGGSNIVVAVIDSGVDATRTDEFDSRVVEVYDGPQDGAHFHGTVCASQIAGNISGFVPDATILNVKTFNQSRTSSVSATTLGMDALLAWAQANLLPTQFLLINCSFVQQSFSNNPFADIMDDLWDEGAIFFAATGNSAQNADELPNFFPGSALTYSNIGAVDLRGKLTQFTHYNGNVSIYALGWTNPGATVGSGSVYATGTSFACPSAVGAFASWVQDQTVPSDKAEGDALVLDWRDNWCKKGNFRLDNAPNGDQNIQVSDLVLARSFPSNVL